MLDSGSNTPNRSVKTIKNMNADKNENGKGSHTSLLIFPMPQGYTSRSTNSSPFKNLQQPNLFEDQTKVASIRHYPKRLMTSHPNLSIDNENGDHLASTTYESSTLKHSSLKKYDHSRPKLFNIFKRNPSPNFTTEVTKPTPIKPIPSTSQTLKTFDKKPPPSCFPKLPMPFTAAKPPRKKNNLQTQNKISETYQYDNNSQNNSTKIHKNIENNAETNIGLVGNDKKICEKFVMSFDFPPPPPQFANNQTKNSHIEKKINDTNENVVMRTKKLPLQNTVERSSKPHLPPPLPQRSSSRPMSSFFADQQISLTTLGDHNNGIYSNTQLLNFNSNEPNHDDFKLPKRIASISKKRLSFQEEQKNKELKSEAHIDDNFQFPEPPAFLTYKNNSKRLNRNSYLSEQNLKKKIYREPSLSSYSELYENRTSFETAQTSSPQKHNICLEETIPQTREGLEVFNREQNEVTEFRFVSGRSVPVDPDISRRIPETHQNLYHDTHHETVSADEFEDTSG